MLHHFGESSASYRVRVALNLKHLEYDSVLVDIRAGKHQTSAYGAVNPQRLVPCLTSSEGITIGQSVAIIEFLEERYPDNPLLPANPSERACARSFVQNIACDVSPFQKTTLQLHLRDLYGLDSVAINEWLSYWMHRGLKALEADASERLDCRPFLFGDQPSVAECFVVPQLHNLRKWDVAVDKLPTLVELERRCMELPAFREAHPSRWLE